MLFLFFWESNWDQHRQLSEQYLRFKHTLFNTKTKEILLITIQNLKGKGKNDFLEYHCDPLGEQHLPHFQLSNLLHHATDLLKCHGLGEIRLNLSDISMFLATHFGFQSNFSDEFGPSTLQVHYEYQHCTSVQSNCHIFIPHIASMFSFKKSFQL